MIASFGLLHLGMEIGRVLRVCGSSVSVVAELPCAGQPGDRHCSLAIFSLARDSSTGFWAVSGSTLYHFRADTIDQREPIPELQRRAGRTFVTSCKGQPRTRVQERGASGPVTVRLLMTQGMRSV